MTGASTPTLFSIEPFGMAILPKLNLSKMKNYSISINTNRFRFQDATYQKIGTVKAKSKKEAGELFYDACQGVDNDARVYTIAQSEVTTQNRGGKGFKIEITSDLD